MSLKKEVSQRQAGLHLLRRHIYCKCCGSLEGNSWRWCKQGSFDRKEERRYLKIWIVSFLGNSGQNFHTLIQDKRNRSLVEISCWINLLKRKNKIEYKGNMSATYLTEQYDGSPAVRSNDTVEFVLCFGSLLWFIQTNWNILFLTACHRPDPNHTSVAQK